MNNRIEMHIAVHEPTGKLIGIDKANKGKNCQCHCVSCKGELIAKQGKENQWHFAHYHNSKKECDYSFWVVCRDLAKQIFISNEIPLNKICLSKESGWTTIHEVSTSDTKHDGKIFDISFNTQRYGRIFVYFLTPEYNRYCYDLSNIMSENVLLINLNSLKNYREEITEVLKSLIIEGLNEKEFFQNKKILEYQNVPGQRSLFEEFDREEGAFEKKVEIKTQVKEISNSKVNIPDLSIYNGSVFISQLKEPRFDINTTKFTQNEISSIYSLDSIFLNFMARYGYDCNKSFMFKELANDKKVYFASYNYTFVGYIMLDVKFILFVQKNKSLVPIFSTPFKDNVGRKIKSSMLN